MDKFVSDLTSKIIVTPHEQALIVHAFRVIKLAKKQPLLRVNQPCTDYFFLEQGLLRFMLEQDEKVETAWVVLESTFFTNIFSIKDANPSFFTIEALMPSTVYAIDRSALEELVEQVPRFNTYLRLTWEQNFCNLSETKLVQQYGDAEKRYQFFQRNLRLMQAVPQKYVASFMGITPTSLSRLRRKKN
jgi:CRP-like cAMP-binding protein